MRETLHTFPGESVGKRAKFPGETGSVSRALLLHQEGREHAASRNSTRCMNQSQASVTTE